MRFVVLAVSKANHLTAVHLNCMAEVNISMLNFNTFSTTWVLFVSDEQFGFIATLPDGFGLFL